MAVYKSSVDHELFSKSCCSTDFILFFSFYHFSSTQTLLGNNGKTCLSHSQYINIEYKYNKNAHFAIAKRTLISLKSNEMIGYNNRKVKKISILNNAMRMIFYNDLMNTWTPFAVFMKEKWKVRIGF